MMVLHHGAHFGRRMVADVVAGAGANSPHGLPVLLLAAMLLVGVALLAWWLWTRESRRAAERASGSAEVKDNIDGQILSMLTQAGGSLNQTRIRESLGLSVGEVALALRKLEDEGRIGRLWQPDGYTYLVNARR